jgi:uncharacterized protein YkwD
MAYDLWGGLRTSESRKDAVKKRRCGFQKLDYWVPSGQPMTHRKLPILVVVVAVLVAGASSSVHASVLPPRVKMLRLLNQTRRSHGLPIFRLNASVSYRASLHSKAMARRNGLFHTVNLYDAVRAYRPSAWGENVAMGGSLRRVRTLWMRSAGHRANVVNPRYRRIGVGVVNARGALWVTTIFYGG